MLIFVNAFFAMSEIAIISINSQKMKRLAEGGNKAAKRLLAITDSPSDFLATIQVGVTLSGFLNSAVAADNFAGPVAGLLSFLPLPAAVLRSVVLVVITIIISYFTLILGELVPKRVAMKDPDAVALRPAFEAQEADVRTKAQLQVPQKDAIARRAAAQVTDGDLVFLDAGTTTLHMVEYLGASRATFVTNGVACARRLVEKGLRAYVLGGLLKPRTEAVVGGVALEMMANYNFTKAFLGANGISIERGYTTPDTEEACIKEKAVQRAFTSYVLADATKFGKAAAITVCPLEKARIITDSLPDESYRRYTVIEEVQA